jgi:hypothetical protein
MRAAGIVLLALAGLTAYWVVTGRQTSLPQLNTNVLQLTGSGTGGAVSQPGLTGLTDTGFTAPAPVTPPLNLLTQPRGGVVPPSVTAVNPTLDQLLNP